MKAMAGELVQLRQSRTSVRGQSDDVARLQAVLKEKNAFVERYKLAIRTL
jgi:hypothetical protein